MSDRSELRDLRVKSCRSLRRGFTLWETIAAVAILAALATIVLSTDLVVSPNDRERYKAAADTLVRLREAIYGTQPTRVQTSFKWVIGAQPLRLSHLTTLITQSDKNICGVAYSATQVGKWK